MPHKETVKPFHSMYMTASVTEEEMSEGVYYRETV